MNIENNTDFPQIIINSIPAPELVENKVQRKEIQYYLEGLREIDQMDVDFIVMVCNTIHLYIKILQKNISAPIINLQKEVEKELTLKNKKFLILGTPKTINELYNFKKLKIIKPTNKEILEISKIIYYYNKGVKQRNQTKKLIDICKRYTNKTDYVVSGCTELSVMLHNTNFCVIDTMEILLNSTIKQLQIQKDEIKKVKGVE